MFSWLFRKYEPTDEVRAIGESIDRGEWRFTGSYYVEHESNGGRIFTSDSSNSVWLMFPPMYLSSGDQWYLRRKLDALAGRMFIKHSQDESVEVHTVEVRSIPYRKDAS